MRSNEHVILFRNPSVDPEQRDTGEDPYESAITDRGLIAHTHPVLGQEFVNDVQLAEIVRRPEDWAAVIATSKRAGEAWVNAIRCRQAEEGEINWNQIPLYTPGSATTNAFSAPDLSSRYFPTIVRESEDTGCAENLGPFIVFDTHRRRRRLANPAAELSPFLVLTGDKNSPELTDFLQRNKLDYRELEVYRTCPRQDISPRLITLLRGISASHYPEPTEEPIIVWFACFSPSSAEAVLRAQVAFTSTQGSTSRFWFEDTVIDLGSQYKVDMRIRVAAIGKTTRNYLCQQGFEAVVQAEKPNPECLARAIAEG
ncbi:hypothetical protein QFC19_004159 [Naganishia cerealis]|uniref:Uncharacterized protein n=1 Tax=Naganishia cerealis TaxID=610337 RepID=A0ACC2VYT2_9TREE|nr:hypothetical protein QFC19_004159 [Naganishia cerealis]